MRKISLVLFLSSLVLLVTSCSWEVPENISVKTKASYNFSFGNYKQSFEDEINLASIMEQVEYPGAVVYDYFPGEKDITTQEYLLKFPLQEIPVDFGKYFKQTNLSRSIAGLSFEKEIKIPVVSFEFGVKLDMSPVNSAINEILVFKGPAIDTNLGVLIAAAKAATGKSFSSISYESGTYVVSCDGMNGETVTLSNGSQSRTATFYNGTARINVDDFDFIADRMRLSFSSPNPLKTFTTSVSSSSRIKTIRGFTGNISTNIREDAKGLSSLDTVESCVIGEGNLDLNFKVPSQWSGVTVDYGIQFHGGIETVKGEFSSLENPAKFNLADAAIGPEDIIIDTDLSLKMTNAELDLTQNPSFTVKSNIKTIKSVIVKISDKPLVVDKAQDISEEMCNTVKEIVLSESGVKGTYTNTLPEGNDVNMTISSKFFAINEQTATLQSGEVDKAFEIHGASSDHVIKPVQNPVAADEFNAYDFNVALTFPGDDHSKINVKNVAPGATYKLSLELENDINWKSISLSAPVQADKENVIPLGINPSELISSFTDSFGSGLKGKLQFPPVMLYLYFVIPEHPYFANVKFENSYINMYNSDGKEAASAIKKQSILDKNTSLLPKRIPDLNETKGVVTTNVGNEPCSYSIDIASMFNEESSKDSQLYVDYSMHMSGMSDITLTREDVENCESATIAMYAFIHIPLRFIVKEEINLSMKEMMAMGGSSGGLDSDIMGRDSASSLDPNIEKYMDAFRSVSLIYTPKALPFYSDGLRLIVDLLGNGKVQKYKFEHDVPDSVTVDYATLQSILTTYPVIPDVSIYVKEDSYFSIPRKLELDINLALNIQTDGTIDLKGGN